jgi:hypothetical protein
MERNFKAVFDKFNVLEPLLVEINAQKCITESYNFKFIIVVSFTTCIETFEGQ